jgi:hypothetical protein
MPPMRPKRSKNQGREAGLDPGRYRTGRIERDRVDKEDPRSHAESAHSDFIDAQGILSVERG